MGETARPHPEEGAAATRKRMRLAPVASWLETKAGKYKKTRRQQKCDRAITDLALPPMCGLGAVDERRCPSLRPEQGYHRDAEAQKDQDFNQERPEPKISGSRRAEAVGVEILLLLIHTRASHSRRPLLHACISDTENHRAAPRRAADSTSLYPRPPGSARGAAEWSIRRWSPTNPWPVRKLVRLALYRVS